MDRTDSKGGTNEDTNNDAEPNFSYLTGPIDFWAWMASRRHLWDG